MNKFYIFVTIKFVIKEAKFMENLKIAIGADHGGVELKKVIIEYLQKKGIETQNFGTDTSESVDYPVIANKVVSAILNKTCAKGILICGTGIGMSISANRHRGIRAVVCSDTTSAKYSRLHNDANILCLGGRIIGTEAAKDIVDVWLSTEFENEERHKNRINLIEKF